MSKQIQDAYIVAATRTPVGKAPKGVFRNTRPDEMLAHVLKAVVAQAPGIDTSRIDDAIIGCAMPEGEQGMNVARIGVLLAGLPNTVAAQTINRFALRPAGRGAGGRPDPARQRRPDARGTESMSMVLMMGNKVALSPQAFARVENATATAWASPPKGRGVEGLARRPGRLRPPAQQGARPRPPASSPRRSRPTRWSPRA